MKAQTNNIQRPPIQQAILKPFPQPVKKVIDKDVERLVRYSSQEDTRSLSTPLRKTMMPVLEQESSR